MHITLDNLIACLLWSQLFCGLWFIVFKSPLVVHLLDRCIAGEFTTPNDVSNYLLVNRRWFLHGLWTCPACQAVWTSGFTAVAFTAGAWGPAGLLFSPILLLILLPSIRCLQKNL